MGIGSIFSKIFNTLQPVYDLAQFGQEVLLYFTLIDNAGAGTLRLQPTQNRHMLDVGQDALATPLSETGTLASPTIFNQIFEKLTDMPYWIFGLKAQIAAQITVGVGNTITTSCRLLVELVESGTITPIYDETISVAGIVANEYQLYQFPQRAFTKLVSQHAILRFTLNYTGTRTAGASNPQGFIWNVRAGASSVLLHLHPAYNHADTVFGTGRAS